MKQFCPSGHDTFICGRKSSGRCRKCHNLSAIAWAKRNHIKTYASVQKRRDQHKKFIYDLKNKPCTDCKKRYPPYVMQFDHVSAEPKIRDISHWSTCSFSGLIREIEKCELVCANCHAIRTHQRNQNKQKGEYHVINS